MTLIKTKGKLAKSLKNLEWRIQMGENCCKKYKEGGTAKGRK